MDALLLSNVNLFVAVCALTDNGLSELIRWCLRNAALRFVRPLHWRLHTGPSDQTLFISTIALAPFKCSQWNQQLTQILQGTCMQCLYIKQLFGSQYDDYVS